MGARLRGARTLRLVSTQPTPPAGPDFMDPESDRLLEEAADAIAEALGEQLALEDLIACGELDRR